MIEIEKKFRIEKDLLERLLIGAELVGKKEFTDVYYDTHDHALTKKDIWLRARAGRFELKVPMGTGKGKGKGMDSYEELEEEALIATRLGLPASGNFEDSLSRAGYQPFATIVTKRTKYKKDGFGIDVDDAGYYAVMEIERMVESEDEMAEAERNIADFASAHGLVLGQVRGKVIEYLAQNDPAHLRALEEAWGVTL